MIESPYAKVNQNAPIKAVLLTEYPSIKGNGKQYHSPFREDRDPSFHVYEEDNHCFDFGTWTNYTPIDLVRIHRGLTIRQAAEALNDEFKCGAVFSDRKPDKRRVRKCEQKHGVISAMISNENNVKILRDAGKDQEADALEKTANVWELYAFEEDAPEESLRIIEQRAIDIFGANAVHGELVDAGLEAVSDVGILARKASDFSGIPVKFLWYPFLPIREYAFMAAPGGSGKGMAAALIASYISAGKPLPEETECPDALRAWDPNEPRNVIIISSEEHGDFISAQVEISGGDPDRIIVIDKEAVPKAGLNLSEPEGLSRLKALIEQYEAALTVIDPIQAFLDKTDINKMASVRAIMAGISNVALETNSAILLIGHTRKGGEGDLNDSISGSVDIVNAARSVFHITRDYEDGNPLTDNRLIIHTKANGSRLGKSLRFRIETGEINREDQSISVPGGVFVTDDLYSEVTKDVIEEARLMKITVGRYLQIKATELSEFEEVLETIRTEAERMKQNGITETKNHCENIAGLKKPYAVTISKIAPKLSLEGITVKFLEQLKLEKTNKAGILIQRKK